MYFYDRIQKNLPYFFTDIRYDLINDFSWSQEDNKHSLKFKGSPKVGKSKFYRFSCVIINDFFCDRILNCFWLKLFVEDYYGVINGVTSS